MEKFKFITELELYKHLKKKFKSIKLQLKFLTGPQFFC
jgi:hypothetical protein